MDKKSGISPFANKVFELARNFRMTGELVAKAEGVLEGLLARCEDLPILLAELGCEEEELYEAAMRYYKLKAEAEAISQLAIECRDRAEALAEEAVSDEYFGPYLQREVVEHHQGVFSPETLTAARKVCARYMKRLKNKGS
jgi:hypothetical protein